MSTTAHWQIDGDGFNSNDYRFERNSGQPTRRFGTGEIIEKSETSGKSRTDEGGSPAATPVTALNVQASDNVAARSGVQTFC